jgi:hypothetical protein
MDEWAWEQLRRWLSERAQLPVGPRRAETIVARLFHLWSGQPPRVPQPRGEQ